MNKPHHVVDLTTKYKYTLDRLSPLAIDSLLKSSNNLAIVKNTVQSSHTEAVSFLETIVNEKLEELQNGNS